MVFNVSHHLPAIKKSLLPGLGSVIGGAGGIAGAIANLLSQKKTREQQLALQERAWEREDTAVQRRAADLEMAGLSKTLAAGGGAYSMVPIQVKAPQIAEGAAGAAVQSALGVQSGVLNLMQQKKQIAVSDAQQRLISEQVGLARESFHILHESGQSKIDVQRAKADQAEHDLKQWKLLGRPKGTLDKASGVALTAWNAIQGILNKYGGK
ncbi:hypothetical protein ES705_50764 [subsurface metagenome]